MKHLSEAEPARETDEKLVSRLRRKVDRDAPGLIHTRRGFGYWLGHIDAEEELRSSRAAVGAARAKLAAANSQVSSAWSPSQSVARLHSHASCRPGARSC